MIRFFAIHPTAANLLMLLFLALGLMALPTLQRETFPDFESREVEIKVPYPGASASDVEEAICLRVEDAVDGVDGVVETRCEAREGMGVVVTKMREDGDFARFLDDIKTEVDAIDNFPDLVESPVISQLARTDAVVSLAVAGPMSAPDLRALAEQLKTGLQRQAGVSLVTINGFSQHQLRVRVGDQVLRSYALSIDNVADAIARQSIDLPAGSVETRDFEVLVRFADLRRTVAELADLVIIGQQGGAGEVRLGDIATITDQFDLAHDKIVLDGERAAVLRIEKNKAEDTLTVMAAVREFVEQERQRLPSTVRLVLTDDVASVVSDRLQMLFKNGLQGLILVFLVMWLFFRLQFSFWVTMGLPVSFLGGLFFMALTGQSINMITMVGLLIALGLLMDDAIVISENIATHLRRGKTTLDAAIDGVGEVAPGVVASFLTTAVVFGPLAFLSGDIGKVLKVMPVVLILVLSVSLVEAFFILPNHLSHAIDNTSKDGRFRCWFNSCLDNFKERILGRAVDWAVANRYLFVGAVIAVFLVSMGMIAGGRLKFQAFPELEGDVIEARLLLPQGTPLWRTEAYVERLTQALHVVDEEFAPADADGERLVKHISVYYNLNRDAHEPGTHVATIKVDLLGSGFRQATVDDVIARWRSAVGPLPDVIALNFKEPVIGPGGLPIDIRIKGDDLATLKRGATEMTAWLSSYKGVFDVYDDLRPSKPELTLGLRDGALALGLNATEIDKQLRAAFHGVTATEIQVGSESVEVDVRLSETDTATLDDLAYFLVSTVTGERVPLASVVDIASARDYGRIHRIDGARTITIEGDIDVRVANVASIINDTSERFLPEFKDRYPDLEVELGGQSKESATTGDSVRRSFLIALVGIFVLLSFQFRNYVEPLVVMSAIPLALIGVIWGHLFMGLDLSMPSIMGYASLAGIVVNDSILLVEFLNRRVAEGSDVVTAAKLASRDRFRAVLLTSLTTIAGLLPLLSETSLQAQVLIPLVTSLVFGLLATTLLVLLVVPAAFSILHDLGLSSASVQGGRDQLSTDLAGGGESV